MAPRSDKPPIAKTTYQITLAYVGTDYAGWQRQPEKITVQSCVEDAVAQVWRQKIDVHASGRTDTGVHALGQVASFIAEKKHSPTVVVRALNNNLPRTIQVVKARLRPLEFHARFDARRKTYEYHLWNAPVFDPFLLNRACHAPMPLDLTAMRRAARLLIGKKDFASFTSNPGYERRTTVRNVHAARLIVEGNLIRFQITANGFLFRMVRNIAGALIKVGTKKMTVAEFHTVLKGKDRAHGAPTAPACGLYLLKVVY
jgi:tRNA pseudouridine38-40 synthase